RDEHEAVELDLAHRAVPAVGEPDGRPDDPRLRERRVEHAPLPELGLEAVGHAVDAAEPADVLAHDDDAIVVRHRAMQPGAERLGECEGLPGHRATPVVAPVPDAARPPGAPGPPAPSSPCPSSSPNDAR